MGQMGFFDIATRYAGLDAKAVWHYRELLARAGAIEALFEDFDGEQSSSVAA